MDQGGCSTPRRREVLDIAHRGLAGGHFSHNRMVGSLRQYFTLPGMLGATVVPAQNDRKLAGHYNLRCPWWRPP